MPGSFTLSYTKFNVVEPGLRRTYETIRSNIGPDWTVHAVRLLVQVSDGGRAGRSRMDEIDESRVILEINTHPQALKRRCRGTVRLDGVGLIRRSR